MMHNNMTLFEALYLGQLKRSDLYFLHVKCLYIILSCVTKTLVDVNLLLRYF